MYDPYTNAFLFFVLCPGVVLTLGPTTLIAALVHAVVFWVFMQYMQMFIPWWGIWVLGAALVGFMNYRTVAPTYVGGRR